MKEFMASVWMLFEINFETIHISQIQNIYSEAYIGKKSTN